ncbi:MAG TPA: hypothetical protein PLS50_03465 [Candidatus Dojkabacteria bacterium]|nr:hypothetical protein [Candidatus Dojkabacteria bacterium]
MQKYETEFEGYEPLKYRSEDDSIITSKTYKINVGKCQIINNLNRIQKVSTSPKG